MPSLHALATTLSRLQDINAYSDRGAAAKAELHRAGRSFLRQLAKELEIPPADFDVRSNQGGIAVSGEVTLHSSKLYVQLSESALGSGGVTVLYRSVKGRKDYTGGPNQWTTMQALANGGLAGFKARCAVLQGAPAVSLAPTP